MDLACKNYPELSDTASCAAIELEHLDSSNSLQLKENHLNIPMELKLESIVIGSAL